MKMKYYLLVCTMLFAFQFAKAQETEEAQEGIKIIEKEILVTGTVVDAENKRLKGLSFM